MEFLVGVSKIDLSLNTLIREVIIQVYYFLRLFLQNLIFTYINEKKSFLHGLIKTYTFITGYLIAKWVKDSGEDVDFTFF